MTWRVDEIKLSSSSPLGAARVDALAQFDLIVITGSNGAGKSTLIEPLRKPGAKDTVSCIDEAGASQVYSSAQGVPQSVTFLTSTGLMEKFCDLSQALALAANTTRLSNEKQLLAQVQRALPGDVRDDGNDDPPRLDNLRQTYLQADRVCGERIRTVAEYNRMGEGLAARKHVTWQRFDLGAGERARLEAENTIGPEAREVKGLSELRPSLTAIKGLPVPNAAGQSGATRLDLARKELRAAIDQTRMVIPHAANLDALDALDASQEITQSARHVLDSLQVAADRIQAVLDAKDLLGECRHNALEYLGSQHARDGNAVNCPVCDRSTDPAELSRSLESQVASEDAESLQLRDSMTEIERSSDELDSRLKEFERAVDQANSEHKRILAAIRPLSQQLRPVIGWDNSVTNAADALRADCETWTQEHAAGPSFVANEAARKFCQRAEQESNRLEAEERQLNAALGPAQNEFRNLQMLGAAIAARYALDNLSWEVHLDQIDVGRRRMAQHDRWLAALQAMASERGASELTAAKEVVNDPGVQSRFQGLLERLALRHPGLQSLGFRGKAVERNGQDVGKTLSEGQTVLVNIAAAMAVVGKVAGTPSHRPGWIVFDEPTNGLDDEGREQVADYLGGLTTDEVPSQIVVTTFNKDFAERLMTAATQAGRRVQHVDLPDFQLGRPFSPTLRPR